MFRKLLILFGLMASPAFGQELPPPYPPPVLDPVATQTYTLDGTTVPLTNVQQDGTPITLYDDGNTRVQLPFEFYFFGNPFNSINISQNGYISFTGNSNGCCDGRPLPDFDMGSPYSDTRNSIFAMWNDLADFNNPGNPYTKSFEDRFVVGWYNIEELGTASQNCALDIFGLPLFCNPIGPNRFNFEITLFRNYDFSINYGDIDVSNVREFERFTAGYQGDTTSEVYTIYHGNNPTTLEYRTFTFVSDYTPIDTTVDCSLDPYDPTCIIDSLIPDTTEEVLADTTTEETGSDDGSDDGTEVVEEEEELLADEDIVDEELLDEEQLVADEETSEEQLEELLAEVEEESDSFTEPAVVATYRELSDEEKAAILADAISKNTLESALSIAADATTSATSTTAAANTEISSSSSSSRSTNESSSSSASTTETTLVAEMVVEQKEETSTSAGDASLDILETGRQIGQQALSETMAATESSANDSMKEAESVAAFSSENSSNQSAAVASNDSQSNDASSQLASEQQFTETQAAIVTSEETSQQEIVVADSGVETVIDMGLSNDVGVTDSTSQIVEEANMLADSLLRGPEVESAESDDVLAIVEASRATSEQKTFEDETNADAEVTSAMIDPALAVANTFNQAPSMMSLDFLGVLKPIEEKSDAELRSEQVVAANKEEQDAINANYMDADQSGIVAAIGADADVSSYLSARLADNNTWYKPEDIYKGVVIKDNARGSYFLEKGNTDTYKKMVDEQYK
jgi:hypothetical protein